MQPQIAWKVANKFSQTYSYWFIQLYRAEDMRTHSTKTELKISGDRKTLVVSHPDVTCKAEEYHFYCDNDNYHHQMM
jgi:endo-alpha-1,4-polygalactosaminidase (GH114 family)